MTTPMSAKSCVPCEGGVPNLDDAQATELLKQLDPAWSLTVGPDNLPRIQRDYEFRDFYRTMAFVNAVAWIANYEGHHPDMVVKYSSCRVELYTHAIDGLSENDFICAAKIDALTSND